MTIRTNDIAHQGLRRLWLSSGLDNSGIPIAWANTLRAALAVLKSAHSLSEIVDAHVQGVRVQKDPSRPNRFFIELNQHWRFTFNVEDPESGVVTALDIEQTPTTE